MLYKQMHSDVTEHAPSINAQTKAYDGGAKVGVRAAYTAFQARSRNGEIEKGAQDLDATRCLSHKR